MTFKKETERNRKLLNHLKLTRLENFAFWIAQLVDVNSSVEIFKVDVDS